jgi:filamentous hemagglutinin
MTNRFDTRQNLVKSALDEVKSSTDLRLDSTLESINSILTPLLRLMPSSIPDLVLSVGAISITNPQTNRKRTASAINGLIPAFAGGTITFPAAPGGTITVSPGTNSTLTMGSDHYLKVGIHVDTAGDISLSFGVQGTTEALATVGAAPADTFTAGYVVIRTISSVVQNITSSSINQYSSINSGGGGGGVVTVADSTARNALSPSTGDLVVQLDNFSVYEWDGVKWIDVTSGTTVIDGNYTHTNAARVYKNLVVLGSLTVSANLTVAGDLRINSLSQTTLTNNISVSGDLICAGAFTTSLDSAVCTISVDGNFIANIITIKSIAQLVAISGLVVKGDLISRTSLGAPAAIDCSGETLGGTISSAGLSIDVGGSIYATTLTTSATNPSISTLPGYAGGTILTRRGNIVCTGNITTQGGNTSLVSQTSPAGGNITAYGNIYASNITTSSGVNTAVGGATSAGNSGSIVSTVGDIATGGGITTSAGASGADAASTFAGGLGGNITANRGMILVTGSISCNGGNGGNSGGRAGDISAGSTIKLGGSITSIGGSSTNTTTGTISGRSSTIFSGEDIHLVNLTSQGGNAAATSGGQGGFGGSFTAGGNASFSGNFSIIGGTGSSENGSINAISVSQDLNIAGTFTVETSSTVPTTSSGSISSITIGGNLIVRGAGFSIRNRTGGAINGITVGGNVVVSKFTTVQIQSVGSKAGISGSDISAIDIAGSLYCGTVNIQAAGGGSGNTNGGNLTSLSIKGDIECSGFTINGGSPQGTGVGGSIGTITVSGNIISSSNISILSASAAASGGTGGSMGDIDFNGSVICTSLTMYSGNGSVAGSIPGSWGSSRVNFRGPLTVTQPSGVAAAVSITGGNTGTSLVKGGNSPLVYFFGDVRVDTLTIAAGNHSAGGDAGDTGEINFYGSLRAETATFGPTTGINGVAPSIGFSNFSTIGTLNASPTAMIGAGKLLAVTPKRLASSPTMKGTALLSIGVATTAATCFYASVGSLPGTNKIPENGTGPWKTLTGNHLSGDTTWKWSEAGEGAASGLTAWSVKTTAYTAVSGDRLMADTSGAAFTITLPATPAIGDEVDFADAGGVFATNNLTIARNGSLILGSATDYIVNVNDAIIGFTYSGATRGWVRKL